MAFDNLRRYYKDGGRPVGVKSDKQFNDVLDMAEDSPSCYDDPSKHVVLLFEALRSRLSDRTASGLWFKQCVFDAVLAYTDFDRVRFDSVPLAGRGSSVAMLVYPSLPTGWVVANGPCAYGFVKGAKEAPDFGPLPFGMRYAIFAQVSCRERWRRNDRNAMYAKLAYGDKGVTTLAFYYRERVAAGTESAVKTAESINCKCDYMDHFNTILNKAQMLKWCEAIRDAGSR